MGAQIDVNSIIHTISFGVARVYGFPARLVNISIVVVAYCLQMPINNRIECQKPSLLDVRHALPHLLWSGIGTHKTR